MTAFFAAALLALAPASAADRARKGDGDWTTIGRTYTEQFFSPLKKINADNVKTLGLAWFKDLGTSRGLESTPLVVDGVMYNTTPFNTTTAYDAKTGKQLWSFDPQTDREFTRITCCDVVTRGLAYWKGKIIIATLDGRLIALNAKTGKQMWTANTFAGEPDWPYTITGAPRVFDGRILIGNAGADLGARGYVTAYDVETGNKLWRFYTVPGDPKKGFENKAMEMAAKTWNGEWWKLGGGGTVWDGITYDPELKLIYIGVGNGSPWVQKFRSPGGGDNLFLASIVALNADTGEYVWHFQETPGEQFDYTAVQPMVLADLTINGRLRKVIMQAPKNGYFYVLDRVTGEFISGQALVKLNWSSGLDPKTGRPNFTPLANYGERPTIISPAFIGAHNWHPMAFSPLTGLVYLSVTENGGVLAERKEFTPQKNVSNPGAQMGGDIKIQSEAANMAKAWLSAWDPVQQTERWRVQRAPNASAGTLATAGNIVFQGTSEQTFAAYRADTGEKLWEMKVDNMPMAAPITYTVGGTQYVALNAGYGGGLAHLEMASGRQPMMAKGRLLVFALGARGMLPPLPAEPPRKPPPRVGMNDVDLKKGKELYETFCQSCHGSQVRGGIKDLRYMDDDTRKTFRDIVAKGTRQGQGMPNFGDTLAPEDVSILQQYVTLRAYEDYGSE